MFSDFYKKDGYLYNLATKEIKPVLSGELDIQFYCKTEVHRVSKQRFITVGAVKGRVKKIELFTNKSATYFETRVIADYGSVF